MEEPSHIPVQILVGAMRTATKYLMDKEQAAIVRVIRSRGCTNDYSGAIANLCFIAEFPGHFKKGDALEVFDQVCSTSHYPSTEDLKRLMDHPHLLVAMMKCREGSLKPNRAVWNPKLTSPPWSPAPPIKKVITPKDEWVNDQLDLLGLGK